MPTPLITIRGVRGSLPVAGAEFEQFGGNTTCIELVLSEDRRLLIDAGSGLHRMQREFGDRIRAVRCWDLLLTHWHWDHLMGLPLFAPLHDPNSDFSIIGPAWNGVTPRELLLRAISPPLFPLEFHRDDVRQLVDGPFDIGQVTIRSAPLNHPQGCRAYRIEHAGRALVIATDHEAGVTEFDDGLVSLATGADLLLIDAQYLPEEIPAHRGWGHSSWRDAVRIAQRAGVARALLTHHDPARTDRELMAIEQQARALWPGVAVAREGMSFQLG